MISCLDVHLDVSEVEYFFFVYCLTLIMYITEISNVVVLSVNTVYYFVFIYNFINYHRSVSISLYLIKY